MTSKLNPEFTEAMISWYRENRRDLPWRSDREPYHIWVSEIMLQQTRVEAVREYYLRWMEALPDIAALAEAEEEQLLKLWQGLGYYNRVRNLQAAARQIIGEYGGIFPEEPDKIRALKGIGEYTAGAIASIAFDKAEPAVDGNVLRVMSRLNGDYSDIKAATTKKKVSAQLAEIYPQEGKMCCGDFTQAMIELGAIVCVPNGQPKCQVCPAAHWCQAAAQGIQMELPVKGEKKARRIEERTVFLLRCLREGQSSVMAVRKRPKEGILANLYEFPNLPGEMTADQALKQAEEWGCSPVGLTRSLKCKHVFTHVEWHMTGYYITCTKQGNPEEDADEKRPFRWITEEDMDREVPVPSAFRYFV